VSEVVIGSYNDILEKLTYATDKIILEKWARFFGCIE
jgi:hypothetical protein